ncbi:hypothetical protein LZC95_24145 [Pendulispora brunnea]|uniref:Uncharacterized protein n=1 Tax=Pendulispora brunnea TaxID=2905690 RepID=A0ABZ2KSD8_9BACT
MDTPRRTAFNQAFDKEDLFTRYHRWLESAVGPFPFRLAETPLFVTPELREQLVRSAEEIVGQLSKPETLGELKKAIPAKYDAPGMDPLPDCVQVDFALVEGPGGKLEGKVVELQAFPSLYALETVEADAWNEVLAKVPGLDVEWTCFVEGSRSENIDWIRRMILADNDPEEVVLVDHEPEKQKTAPDFVATKRLFDVNAICVTKLIKEGRRLYRDSGGRRIPVKRIYNRLVFDELAVKGVEPPFDWRDDLDITWCSHPNWYWTWSKYALPFVKHAAVPPTRFLSDIADLPEDLSRYVLKPLFSFAGAGVVIDVTHDVLARLGDAERKNFILQEKVDYAPAIRMPDGNGVKAEVRVMLLRRSLEGPRPLVPLLFLVRTSRGKMLGVDFNKNLTWVGGTVAIWPRE